MRFSGALKRNRVLMGKLFTFYGILGLHGAFRKITPRINEKAPYNQQGWLW